MRGTDRRDMGATTYFDIGSTTYFLATKGTKEHKTDQRICKKFSKTQKGNCRGGPPWPPVARNTRYLKKRAATEGRPYSWSN